MKKILVLMSLILVLAMSGTALAATGGHGAPTPTEPDVSPPVVISLVVNIATETITNIVNNITNISSVNGMTKVESSTIEQSTINTIETAITAIFALDDNISYTVNSVILPLLRAILTPVQNAQVQALATMRADSEPHYAINVPGAELLKNLPIGDTPLSASTLKLYLKNVDTAEEKLTEMKPFYFFDKNGAVPSTIEANQDYYVVAAFKDGAPYDLDETPDNGAVDVCLAGGEAREIQRHRAGEGGPHRGRGPRPDQPRYRA